MGGGIQSIHRFNLIHMNMMLLLIATAVVLFFVIITVAFYYTTKDETKDQAQKEE